VDGSGLHSGGRGSGTGGGAEETGKTEQSMCSGKKMRGEGDRGPVCKTEEL
jgi:hypothetical protein